MAKFCNGSLALSSNTETLYEQNTHSPINGMESGNLSLKKFIKSSSVLMSEKMSKGMNRVHVNDLSKLGNAIIINSFLGQMCR